MSDKQFTFFELHFHDGFQIGPRSLGDAAELDDGDADTTASAGAESTTEESATAAEEGSGPSVLGPLLGLGALAGLAYAVRKLLAGVEPEGFDALDDIEEELEGDTDDLRGDEDAVAIEITSSEDEESDGALLRLLAGAVVLLVLFVLGAKQLLSGSEEIVVED